jgi:hypothetical protein
MEVIRIVIQIVIALGIINVWLIRFNKSTGWRGGSAHNLKEEFTVYGLPGWMVWLVGALKLLFAATLIAGIWFPDLAIRAASGIAVLMIGAIVMHIKVKDPIKKSLPAFIMLALSIFFILT